MALTKPFVDSIVAFDATDSHTFTFESIGGDQPLYNVLKIYDENNTLVTSHTQGSATNPHYTFTNTIDANTLTNGKLYYATITTCISENEYSAESAKVGFYCYTTPTFTFDEIGSTITSASYTFDVTYSQIEGEYLAYYYYELYNNVNTLIDKSDTVYVEKTAHTQQGDTVSYVASHTFYNLEEAQSYYLKIYGVTERQTVIEETSSVFTIHYTSPIVYSELYTTNDAYNGQVIIRSNISAIEGSTPSTPIYIGNSAIDLTATDNYVQWNNGFTVPSTGFCYRFWFTPYALNKTLIRLIDDNGVVYKISLVRKLYDESSGGGTSATAYTDASNNILTDASNNVLVAEGGSGYSWKDYFYLVGQEGSHVVARMSTDLLTPLNSTSQVMVSFAFDGSNYYFDADVLSQETTVLEWNNSSSNVIYGGLTDVMYENEVVPDEDYYVHYPDYWSTDIGNVTDVTIYNGIYDQVTITNDYTDYQDTTQPTEWDETTILNCDFSGTINGGNIDFTLSEVDTVRLMRQEDGTTNWITLVEQSVSSIDDMNILYYDRFTPSGKTFTYAYVPILNGAYDAMITRTITTAFNEATFICDKTGVFKLYANVELGSETQNQQNATLLPINSNYPIIIENSATNYKTGSLSGYILGYEFESTVFTNEIYRTIDRPDAVQQKEDFLSFLTNKKAKIIKDWNGNIYLCRVVDSPTASFNASYGNGIITVAFNFVEQGKWNNQSDLYYCGLTDVK